MPVKIIHPDHVEIVGIGRVLLIAPHVASPDADLYTGSIVEEAALTSRSYAVIGKVREDGIRYVLDIHGKKDPGVDIGTALGQMSSDSTMELVRARLVKDFAITMDKEFVKPEPRSIVTSYSQKDEKGDFVVETIQIDFGHEERQFQREKVISDLSEIADILNGRLMASRDD